MKIIKITRGQDGHAVFRGYKVFIDDVYRGDIEYNQTKEFEIREGMHTVYAKIDWCRSNEVYVDADDPIIEFEIGSSVIGWRIFFHSFYATIWKDKYLFLREKGTVPKKIKRPLPKWAQWIYDKI